MCTSRREWLPRFQRKKRWISGPCSPQHSNEGDKDGRYNSISNAIDNATSRPNYQPERKEQYALQFRSRFCLEYTREQQQAFHRNESDADSNQHQPFKRQFNHDNFKRRRLILFRGFHP